MTRLVYLAALAAAGRMPTSLWLALSCEDRVTVWRLMDGMRRAS